MAYRELAYYDMEYYDMEYRELGRTGLTVSAVGMGCEGFEGKTQEESGKLMGAAMDAGICFFDMYTPSPAVRRAMGQALRASFQGHCMYCGHCAPCPAGIDIAKINQFYDLSVAQGSAPETVKDHYDRLGKGASACIGCGACEGRCPFQVAVREKMKEAARLFGR